MPALTIPGFATDRIVLRYRAALDKLSLSALADQFLADEAGIINATVAGVKSGHPDAAAAYAAAVELRPESGDGTTVFDVNPTDAVLATFRTFSGGAIPLELVLAGVIHRAAQRHSDAYVAWADEMLIAMIETS